MVNWEEYLAIDSDLDDNTISTPESSRKGIGPFLYTKIESKDELMSTYSATRSIRSAKPSDEKKYSRIIHRFEEEYSTNNGFDEDSFEEPTTAFRFPSPYVEVPATSLNVNEVLTEDERYLIFEEMKNQIIHGIQKAKISPIDLKSQIIANFNPLILNTSEQLRNFAKRIILRAEDRKRRVIIFSRVEDQFFVFGIVLDNSAEKIFENLMKYEPEFFTRFPIEFKRLSQPKIRFR